MCEKGGYVLKDALVQSEGRGLGMSRLRCVGLCGVCVREA